MTLEALKYQRMMRGAAGVVPVPVREVDTIPSAGNGFSLEGKEMARYGDCSEESCEAVNVPLIGDICRKCYDRKKTQERLIRKNGAVPESVKKDSVLMQDVKKKRQQGGGTPMSEQPAPEKGFEWYTCPDCNAVREKLIGQTECPACGYDPADVKTAGGILLPSGSVMTPEAYPVPKSSPGLDGLIPEINPNTMEIPAELMSRMQAAGVYADDVLALIRMLLAGKLRRVAE